MLVLMLEHYYCLTAESGELLSIYRAIPTKFVPPVDSIQLYLTSSHILPSQLDNVKVDDNRSMVRIWFTPTIPHCR